MRFNAGLFSFVAVLLLQGSTTAFMHSDTKRELRDKTKELWDHGYNSYKRFAFPADELLPLSCKGQGHDRINLNNEVNDVMGDYALTLVDSLDSWAVFGDKDGFENAVRETIQYVNFELDSRVQVFEVTIRMLGGLLSGHILATDPKRGFLLPWYSDELLNLARDLGRRLLPAFETPTGIPYARVHLQLGVLKGETKETCTAGAGSLLLEFGTLSRLTGDPIYEEKAKKAFYALWNRRSPIGLLGNTIGVDGNWITVIGSTGAGIDSFYEYAAKAYIFFGEDEWWRVWEEAYSAIIKYVRGPEGFWYRGVNMQTGQIATVIVDSLSAFFPGTQTLVGDLEAAIKSHAVFAYQWKRYGGIPETFDINRRHGVHLGYPLRPEFIESNLYLYQATNDEFYLEMAAEVLHDINNRTRVECGLAAITDLSKNPALEDKQPSFVTSETLKYLYLTFDENNQFNKDDSNMVFTTEGHMLQVDTKPIAGRRRRSIPVAAPSCPAYDPLNSPHAQHFLSTGIERRKDLEYARFATGYQVLDEIREWETGRWSENGMCSLPPTTEDYTIELLFASNGDPEDLDPPLSKVLPVDGTVLISEIAGLRFSITKSWGEGFLISKVGNIKIPAGKFVHINDESVLRTIQREPPHHHLLHLSITAPSLSNGPPGSDLFEDEILVLEALAASFGPSLAPPSTSTSSATHPFALDQYPLSLVRSGDPTGCTYIPHNSNETNPTGKILLVHRGRCQFATKAHIAALSGAKGVIVINHREEEGEITPSSDEAFLKDLGTLVPLVLVSAKEGRRLEEFLEGREEGARVALSIGKEAVVPLQLGGYTVMNVKLVRT